MGIAQRIYQLGSRPSLHTTSAIPGGIAHEGNQGPRPDRVQRRPTEIILGYPLPSSDIMRMLVEEYFDTVHWFSLVIFEPRFRPKFEAVQDGQAQPSQKGFLLLLSVVLGMGAWYKSQRNRIDQNFQGEDWQGWAAALIQGAGSHLIEMMDQTSIASAQACILLGSYYLYHGKPNLSFALLGATIRTAQAIGLHRQPLRGDPNIIEERKRVWWTIYTWDRYETITCDDTLFLLRYIVLHQSHMVDLSASTTKIAPSQIQLIQASAPTSYWIKALIRILPSAIRLISGS